MMRQIPSFMSAPRAWSRKPGLKKVSDAHYLWKGFEVVSSQLSQRNSSYFELASQAHTSIRIMFVTRLLAAGRYIRSANSVKTDAAWLRYGGFCSGVYNVTNSKDVESQTYNERNETVTLTCRQWAQTVCAFSTLKVVLIKCVCIAHTHFRQSCESSELAFLIIIIYFVFPKTLTFINNAQLTSYKIQFKMFFFVAVVANCSA